MLNYNNIEIIIENYWGLIENHFGSLFFEREVVRITILRPSGQTWPLTVLFVMCPLRQLWCMHFIRLPFSFAKIESSFFIQLL